MNLTREEFYLETEKEDIDEGYWQEAYSQELGRHEVKIEGGMKFDQEKNRVDLLDPEFLEGVGRVLTFGARKYAANNWRNGIAFSRLIGAALRHLLAIMRGEDIDPESGEMHVYHLGCCIMFLASMMNHRKDLDDRYKLPN
jgi:hypothetical protein